MEIETREVIFLDALTNESVSILTKTMVLMPTEIVNDDGETEIIMEETQIGENHRCAYVNSVSGRASIANDLAEPYLSAVMEIWGDTPTVSEYDPITSVEEDANNDQV